MEREAEGTGQGSQQVSPDQDSSPDDVERRITSMNAEDGLSNVRPMILGESPQRSQGKLSAEEIDRSGRPGPDSHMGD